MAIDPKDLVRLKDLVQALDPPTKLEHLVAALLGDLIGTRVTVAKSGFQHGADGGTSGRQERYLRVECKRYRDDTALNERELLGEMDHAFARDPALEAWILAATREVNEQLDKALSSKGNSHGVAVLILDWSTHTTPMLAALLASGPDLVNSVIGKEASEIASRLQPEMGATIELLRCELAAWQLGTRTLQQLAKSRLLDIWGNPRQSRAHFGQVVSGGVKPLIHRMSVLNKLDDWWTNPAKLGSPVCINGLFGVGKTWAVVDWLQQQSTDFPTVLLVPASAVPGASQGLGSVYAVKTFLAQRLQELTQVRDVDHWRERIDRMLKRPLDEGCVLVMVLDGMSQRPDVGWIALLSALQADELRGRVRVITTTRSHHFENHLRRLVGLEDRANVIEVDEYDPTPGGELDQMLALHSLSRSDVHPDLHELARNPRLFDLVIHFRDRLSDGNAVTLHRLLWEYGREATGESLQRAFSTPEWDDWLQAVAGSLIEGIRSYSSKDLSALAAPGYTDEKGVYQRLSDIIDTPFVKARADRTLELTAQFVAHALGASAVFLLASNASQDRDSLESTLAQWLDPIAGLDQRGDILQAAVAIALESGPPRALLSVLTAAWLQTQNLAPTHQHDVHLLAPEMPEALLDTIELSHRHTHASSQQAAISALRAVDRGNSKVRDVILQRLADWLRVVSRDVDPRAKAEPEAERHRHERVLARLGVDASGPLTILGETMHLVDRDDTMWAEHTAALLEGYPLSMALPALRIGAIAASVVFNHAGWNQLCWACLLNPLDPEAVAEAVRTESKSMLTRPPESGLHPKLGARVAQLLLRLTGERADDEAAAEIDAKIGSSFSYEADYLANPTKSIFTLERRHAMTALLDEEYRLGFRVQRVGDLWLDPTFEPPASVCDVVAVAADELAVEALYTSRHLTSESHNFEQLQPVLARCAPRQLAALRRRLAQAPVTPQSRAARSWRINEALLLYGPTEASAARAIRTLGREIRDGDELHVASELLLPELKGLDALAQAIVVVEANLPHIPTSITDSVLPLSTVQADELIAHFQSGTGKQRRDVLVLLVTEPPSLSDSAWEWILAYAVSEDEIEQRLAYMALAAADRIRLGRELNQRGWRFTVGTDAFLAHDASGALIAATTSTPFDQVAQRLAPWRLLEAVRQRGGDPSEVRIAAELLDMVLTGGPSQPLDVGAQLSIRRDDDSTRPSWYSVDPLAPAQPNTAEALRDAFDEEAQRVAQERASEIAEASIRKARRDGASLFLEFVGREDAVALCRYSPELVECWIAGHDTLAPDFVRRAQLAEGLFLALCEALLALDPLRGVSVWHALNRTLRTRITGAAKLPELLHMLFRAPRSAEVDAARVNLLALESTKTDADLYQLALAAELNGQGEWLDSLIAQDTASSRPWQQQRAQTMKGFRVGNALPVPDAWPEGFSTSWAQNVRRRAARLEFLEACARHWWNEYWRCEDLEEAYAAWVLFCHCADRRAVAWMATEAANSPNGAELKDAKYRHWHANRQTWKQGADQSSRNLERHFLGRKTEANVWPWRDD